MKYTPLTAGEICTRTVVFADPDQPSLFQPSIATIRSVLTATPGN